MITWRESNFLSFQKVLQWESLTEQQQCQSNFTQFHHSDSEHFQVGLGLWWWWLLWLCNSWKRGRKDDRFNLGWFWSDVLRLSIIGECIQPYPLHHRFPAEHITLSIFSAKSFCPEKILICHPKGTLCRMAGIQPPQKSLCFHVFGKHTMLTSYFDNCTSHIHPRFHNLSETFILQYLEVWRLTD